MQHAESHERYLKKKKTKKKSESVTVLKQFKTPDFDLKMECFFYTHSIHP